MLHAESANGMVTVPLYRIGNGRYAGGSRHRLTLWVAGGGTRTIANILRSTLYQFSTAWR